MLSAFPTLRVGEGLVGRSVSEGEIQIGDPAVSGAPTRRGGESVVAIPSRVDDKPIGTIVIYKLLQQKNGFSALRNELFSLLAGHAATAIFASLLHAQSGRKLSTIQGFIDLLTEFHSGRTDRSETEFGVRCRTWRVSES